jgi:hypothetical protein
MEIEAEKLKETITVLFDNLRAMDTEIQAHKLAIHFLKEGGLIDATIPWEETLDASLDRILCCCRRSQTNTIS